VTAGAGVAAGGTAAVGAGVAAGGTAAVDGLGVVSRDDAHPDPAIQTSMSKTAKR